MSNEHNNAPAVPQGWKLVQTPITEEMHVAAVKVLHRAPGLAGLPQRMLDAMLAATPSQEPVMWQYRSWFAENTGTPGWSEWAEVKARNAYTGTVMDSVREFQHYIAQGYKYEIRALYVATPAPAPAQESINDRSERQFMERMASNHEKLTEFSQTLESFTHDYQRLYSTYKSYRDIIADVIKERDSLREQVAKPAQEVTQSEPIYQLQRGDGSWIDQDKASYDYNAQYGINTIRIVYTAPEPEQEVGLTDEAVNDAARVLAERFDYPWEHMPEEGRKNMRTQARAAVIAALRAKGQG